MVKIHNKKCKECRLDTLLRYPKGYFCWTCKRDIPDPEWTMTTTRPENDISWVADAVDYVAREI